MNDFMHAQQAPFKFFTFIAKVPSVPVSYAGKDDKRHAPQNSLQFSPLL
ncbi:hypothetical protein N481_13985 [Pseudoalteromonas luteoviolacea S4047-1]|uniref:Uncharacterized protein n=1 Tax=Pseudoalteromonas luteoviolacea S4054 TaxID=1129367 RepID=A0A0F6ABG9_9GAMM|nr:hypothetical protein N479_16980 [Pseudoalteromonas luteoviolacea S4054]KZN72960.1 hypothetical protein N481_13985 [Pseudoalteromonas luteoviolacea S4047-1]